MAYDVVVRGGIVVDGSGLPRRRADVGIRDRRIVDVGYLNESSLGARIIDADGMIVAPGIVDVHTHYDPQLTFEPYGTSSCFHGVTTVVAGNCGFSIAPTRVADRDYAERLFACVEGMSPIAMSGIKWDFETFPEYLQARRGNLGLNLACYVGHTAVRRWVMGEASTEREATQHEIDEMCSIVIEAMRAGAAGLSSSHGPTQFDGDNRPIPSRLATYAELEALVSAAGHENGAGSVSYLPAGGVRGMLGGAEEKLLVDLALAGRMPVIIQGLGGRSKMDAPTSETWPETQRFFERTLEAGASVFNLLRNHPYERLFSFDEDGMADNFVSVFSWQRLADMSHAEKISTLRDAHCREEMRYALEHYNQDPAKGTTRIPPRMSDIVVDTVFLPENAKLVNRRIIDIAAETGRAPGDVVLDLVLAEDLRVVFRQVSNDEEWWHAIAASQQHPNMIVGISDGGAHLARDDGADWSSYFLSEWVRKREVWTLEEGIRQLTQIPAGMCGLLGRGSISPGAAADLWCFDFAEIGPDLKRKVADFPGGSARWMTRPKGVHVTIVNGQPILIDGELTGDLPGEVVKPGQPLGTAF